VPPQSQYRGEDGTDMFEDWTNKFSRNFCNYQSTLRNMPEERISHVKYCQYQKSPEIFMLMWMSYSGWANFQKIYYPSQNSRRHNSGKNQVPYP
jgi:hypothetical protein